MTININTLFLAETAERLLALGLQVAQALGLPTTSWRTGDPEPTLLEFTAEALETRDQQLTDYIMAGWLSSAVARARETGSQAWLELLAYEMFGVTVPGAGYATPSITLVNSGGGNYPRGIGEITVRNSSTGKTYHNTDAPAPLNGGATVTYTLEADEAGSASGVAVDEIDEIVTTMLGVTISGNTSGFASDAPTPEEIQTLCLATLGALSPNGPPDAYAYVCLTPALSGQTEVTRAYAYKFSTSGQVQVVVASATGAVSVGSLAQCQDAVEKYATPLCITPTVSSAVPYVVAVTATVHGAAIPSDYVAKIEAAVAAYFASVKIAGTVARSAIIAAIHNAVPEVDVVTLTAPVADIALGALEVPTSGAVSVVEV
jgi:hypothetical protein